MGFQLRLLLMLTGMPCHSVSYPLSVSVLAADKVFLRLDRLVMLFSMSVFLKAQSAC